MLHERRWLLWILVFSVLGRKIANQLGWFAAEVGRQPWIVYHLMRTPAGLSAVVQANVVLTSLILFNVHLFLCCSRCSSTCFNDKIQHGPDDADLTPSGKPGTADKTMTNDEIRMTKRISNDQYPNNIMLGLKRFWHLSFRHYLVIRISS